MNFKQGGGKWVGFDFGEVFCKVMVIMFVDGVVFEDFVFYGLSYDVFVSFMVWLVISGDEMVGVLVF